MRYREFTMEVRKNPEKNPKMVVNDEIYAELDRSIQSNSKIAGNNDNLFVSFTALDKLGINPTSKYNTPVGIYSYPAGYIRDTIGSGSMGKLPFAGKSPYANIFRARGNIVDLIAITSPEKNEYYKKIAQYWSSVSGLDWKTSVDQVEDIINSAHKQARMANYYGGQLWYVTMRVAYMMAQGKSEVRGGANPSAVAWNTLFRNIGIAGCIDNGAGIIHTSEPHQAVFFDISAVEVIDRISNRINYNPDAIARNLRVGQDEKKFKISQYDKLRNLDVESQTRVVMSNPTLIKYMHNPPQDLMWAVLARDPMYIAHIKNPTETMKEVAIKANPSNIQYIKKPSEALKQLAVSLDGGTLEYIMKVPQDPKHMHMLKKQVIYPSEAVQLLAVRNSKGAIKLILNAKITPSEDVQQAAVRTDPGALFLMMYAKRELSAKIGPSEAVQLIAVEADPKLIHELIRNKIVPSTAVIDAALAAAKQIGLTTMTLQSIAYHMRTEGLKVSGWMGWLE